MLTADQISILHRADRSGMILVGDSDTCPEIHFCPDWDRLAICADSPEADGCTCGRISKEAGK